MLKTRVFALALVLFVGLTGSYCGSVTATRSLAVSGESINATGTLFVDTANLLTPPCNAHTLPNWDTVCPKFKSFEQKFKASWPMATGLWYAARKANDPKLQAPAETAISALRAELNTFVTGGK